MHWSKFIGCREESGPFISAGVEIIPWAAESREKRRLGNWAFYNRTLAPRRKGWALGGVMRVHVFFQPYFLDSRRWALSSGCCLRKCQPIFK